MKDIKVNADKKQAISSGAGSATHEQLLDMLSERKGYSMPVQEAIDTLYAGDDRSDQKKKHSFASVKTYCWTKSDWRVEFTDNTRKNIAIVGKRIAGTNQFNPVK